MSRSNPLKSLYPEENKRLSYPNGIEETGHFAMFFLHEDLKYDVKDFEERKSQGTIILPLPADLNTGYAADYSTEEISLAGAATGASISKAIGTGSAKGFINSIKGDVTSGTFDAKELAGSILNSGLQVATSEIASIIPGAESFVKGAMYGAGVARNPHQAVLFNTVGFRTHSFSYNMVPKNFEEQTAINNIIFMLKSAMLPDYLLGNHFFKYPAKFDIKLTTDNTYLFDISASVLTQFDVSYHGQGGDFYHDINGVKAPTSVTISMSFQETSITAREDVVKGGMGGKGNR